MNTKTIQYDPALWQLVPMKANGVMRNAAFSVIGFSAMYEAALAAAPSAPEQDTDAKKSDARYRQGYSDGWRERGEDLTDQPKQFSGCPCAPTGVDGGQCVCATATTEPKQEGLTDERIMEIIEAEFYKDAATMDARILHFARALLASQTATTDQSNVISMHRKADADTDSWNAQREHLERAATKAVLDLFDHTASAALMLGIEGTTPELFIAVGGLEDISKILPKNKLLTGSDTPGLFEQMGLTETTFPGGAK